MCTLTLSLPPLSSSLIFSRASTVLFKSLCRRRPKSLNMVEPPDRTMFCGRKGDGDYKAVEALNTGDLQLVIGQPVWENIPLMCAGSAMGTTWWCEIPLDKHSDATVSLTPFHHFSLYAVRKNVQQAGQRHKICFKT